jgi:hypothetical protein
VKERPVGPGDGRVAAADPTIVGAVVASLVIGEVQVESEAVSVERYSSVNVRHLEHSHQSSMLRHAHSVAEPCPAGLPLMCRSETVRTDPAGPSPHRQATTRIRVRCRTTTVRGGIRLLPIPRSPAVRGRRRVPASERCADARSGWSLVSVRARCIAWTSDRHSRPRCGAVTRRACMLEPGDDPVPRRSAVNLGSDLRGALGHRRRRVSAVPRRYSTKSAAVMPSA